MGLDNPIHLGLLLMILLLVFGAKRLPEMGRSLGDGLRGFKEAVSTHPPADASTAVHAIVPADEQPDSAGMHPIVLPDEQPESAAVGAGVSADAHD